VNDTRLVDAATKSAYGAMSAVSLQNELLKRLRATGSDASVSAGALATLKLEPADARNVNGVLGEIGRDLYLQLFVDALADRELLAIVQDLERLATARPLDRPLRMKIVTARVSLPWQYLHPVGPDIDPAKFWGLRFSLSVARGDSHTTSNVPQGSAHKMVFARYGSTADPTVALAQRQMAQLKGMPMDLLEVKSGTALLDTLKAERSQITAIMAFLHASSGLMTAGPLDEPELLFNEGDVVTGLKLRGLRSLLPPDEAGSLYLRAAPLVILNACETGTSTTLPRVSLENALFSLGARGIVMTEVSVWINLGHEVATRLIERLGRGEAVSDALTGVRRDLYAQKNNPLGLLYLYSGDPAATLRP
jgi:antitoxin component of RelBE/YafQ-DinJ toxin-antitoxin module